MSQTIRAASSRYAAGEPVTSNPHADLTGMRIGHLTAHRPCMRNNHLCWECRCDCGNWCYRRADMLNSSIRLNRKNVHCTACNGKPESYWQDIIDNPEYRRLITRMRNTSPHHHEQEES